MIEEKLQSSNEKRVVPFKNPKVSIVDLRVGLALDALEKQMIGNTERIGY